MKHKTKSEKETKKLGEKLIREATKEGDGPMVIALEGELGSGKTTLVKGIASELDIESNITSPTFLIVKKYPLKKEGFNYLFHVDTYRLDSIDDLKNLDIENILRGKKNIVVIEWANKVKELIPEDAIRIKFKHGKKENERAIMIERDNGKEK